MACCYWRKALVAETRARRCNGKARALAFDLRNARDPLIRVLAYSSALTGIIAFALMRCADARSRSATNASIAFLQLVETIGHGRPFSYFGVQTTYTG
jgi:hypothetical protein